MSGFVPFPAMSQLYAELLAITSLPSRVQRESQIPATRLTEAFLESVEAFREFPIPEPPDPRFFPENAARDEDKNDKSWGEGHTFAWAMAHKNTDRLHSLIEVEGADELSYRYVSREIDPARTLPSMGFEDPTGQRLEIDLLLANAHSRRPIVAELKIKRDKDPFFALVQALAAAAQLTPLKQRRRLERLALDECSDSLLGSSADEPLLDVYVLLANFPGTGDPIFESLKLALTATAELERSPALAKHLGRLRVLRVTGVGIGVVRQPGTVRVSSEPPKRRVQSGAKTDRAAGLG